MFKTRTTGAQGSASGNTSAADRVEDAMRGFLDYKGYPKKKLGDPVQWLPERKKQQVLQQEQERIKESCADSVRLARAKDLAGVSDNQLLTVLKEALPPGWSPSSRHLLQARKEISHSMQVNQQLSPHWCTYRHWWLGSCTFT